MKSFIFSYVVIFMLCQAYSCSSPQKGVDTGSTLEHAAQDTIITHHNICELLSDTTGGKHKVEYFLLSDKDVSSFSCIFEVRGGFVNSITIMSDNYAKASLMNLEELSDSAAFEEEHNEFPTFDLSYQQQIDALKKILEDANRQYSFRHISTLTLNLEDWGDESVSLTENLIKLWNDKIEQKKYNELITKSCLYKDISKLLSDYSISVVDVEIEKIYKIPSTRFLERNKVSRKVPKNIISATMYMKIKAI